jgi:hypothetical protein
MHAPACRNVQQRAGILTGCGVPSLNEQVLVIPVVAPMGGVGQRPDIVTVANLLKSDEERIPFVLASRIRSRHTQHVINECACVLYCRIARPRQCERDGSATAPHFPSTTQTIRKSSSQAFGNYVT